MNEKYDPLPSDQTPAPQTKHHPLHQIQVQMYFLVLFHFSLSEMVTPSISKESISIS